MKKITLLMFVLVVTFFVSHTKAQTNDNGAMIYDQFEGKLTFDDFITATKGEDSVHLAVGAEDFKNSFENYCKKQGKTSEYVRQHLVERAMTDDDIKKHYLSTTKSANGWGVRIGKYAGMAYPGEMGIFYVDGGIDDLVASEYCFNFAKLKATPTTKPFTVAFSDQIAPVDRGSEVNVAGLMTFISVARNGIEQNDNHNADMVIATVNAQAQATRDLLIVGFNGVGQQNVMIHDDVSNILAGLNALKQAPVFTYASITGTPNPCGNCYEPGGGGGGGSFNQVQTSYKPNALDWIGSLGQLGLGVWGNIQQGQALRQQQQGWGGRGGSRGGWNGGGFSNGNAFHYSTTLQSRGIYNAGAGVFVNPSNPGVRGPQIYNSHF